MERVNLSIHVTLETVDQSIAGVRAFGLNVDYIKDMLVHRYYGNDEMYLVISINPSTSSTTCTEFSVDDFNNTWAARPNPDPFDNWIQLIDRKS